MGTVLLATHLGSLLSLPVFLLLPDAGALAAATALSFLHFAATLVFYYGQAERDRRFRALGVYLPLALLAGGAAWMLASPTSLAGALLVFFVLVLWHYAKQSYGLFVYSFRGLGGFDHHDSLERQAVLGAFLWLALYGFVAMQTNPSAQLAFGLYVPSAHLPVGPVATIGRAGAALALAYLSFVCVRYRRFAPFATALAFWVWCDLPLTGFRLVPYLPALHALQYFPVVGWRFSRRGRRVALALGFAGFASAGALGFVLRGVPRFAPALVAFLYAAELTMNLQHYFIDAYIWRAREPGVRADLELG
jgi:hypothetical protein